MSRVGAGVTSRRRFLCDRAGVIACCQVSEIVEESWDNAGTLNQVAWYIADEEGLESA